MQKLILSVFMLFLIAVVNAQDEPSADQGGVFGDNSSAASSGGSFRADAMSTGEDPGGIPTTGPDNEAAVPFDGGVSLLLLAGAGYGLKRIRDEKRKRANSF